MALLINLLGWMVLVGRFRAGRWWRGAVGRRREYAPDRGRCCCMDAFLVYR